MLRPTSGTAVLAAALLVYLVPTIQPLPGQTPAQAQAEPKSKGRIFATAILRHKPEGKDEETEYGGIIAIDPLSGKWQKITEGDSGRVSPDGQTLVFRHRDREQPGIWDCDTLQGNAPGRISDKSGQAIWSPDGKHLVVTEVERLPTEGEKARTKPAWKNQTWKMDSSGRNPVKLPIPETDWVDDWSPDGQWFVTCSDRHKPFGSGCQLYLMKTDGSEERRLTQGGLNADARFSPDGKTIIYTRQTAKDGNSIWVVDIAGKNVRELLKEVNLARPDIALWSPDGKQVAVRLADCKLNENGERFVDNPNDANYRIEIMNADGSNRRELRLADGNLIFVALGDWR